MLHGLHAVHEARDEKGQPLDIVHRDVSTQNVLVGFDGLARILDGSAYGPLVPTNTIPKSTP